ncbi:MAG: hypothetical protein RL693_1470, partial [Verrucomicrobiota bacterium]
KDGRILSEPGRGAIFRCESDGSGFEVFCKGLRNPQELAFDEAGNLFTFDNTGDIGDLARMVYALEGSDSGWNMANQSAHHYVTKLDWEDFHPDVSVWVAEKMYETFTAEQPQWVYPPASHVARGPSGVTWLSGDSLPLDLRGKFLLANYRGAAQGCDVLSVGIEPRGAGYGAISEDVFVQGVGVSDVELGYDGNIYLCDFGGGWSINTSGAIQRLTPKDEAQKKAGAAAQALFAKGLQDEPVPALLGHLESNDKRLRQLAQFELVKRGETAKLSAIAADASKPVKTRLHGIWGVDQAGRKGGDVSAVLLTLAKDKDAEIRANAARTLGSIQAAQSRDTLLTMLNDPSPRVRSLAAIALSRVAKKGDAAVISALYQTAGSNGESGKVDPVLRHSILSALDLLGTIESAKEHAQAPEREVRLLALLYLRRQESAEAAIFLADADPLIRREAVCAIYDTAALDGPAGDAVAALVKEAAAFSATIQQRIVAANYRRGTAGNAKNLIAMAGNGSLDPGTRARALHALRLWEKQITTDPVLGHYRPQIKAERSMAGLGKNIDADLRGLVSHDLPAQLSALALQLADEAGVRLESATLKAFVANAKLDVSLRVAALGSLIRWVPNEAPALISTLLDDPAPAVAAAALGHGFALKMEGLTETATRAIQNGPLEKARAGITGLAGIESPEIATLWQNRQTSELRRELWLDLFLVLQTSPKVEHQTMATTFAATATDAVFRLSETGGDSPRGEKIFRNQGGCLQCHKMGADGGIQGPDLTRVGERLVPTKLVESLVNPNAEIAQGYGLAAITLTDGNLVMGRIAKQTKEQISVIGIDGKETTLAASTVTTIAPPVSAMPPLGMSLPPRDLRDLIAYLTTRNTRTMGSETNDSSHGEKEKEKVAK